MWAEYPMCSVSKVYPFQTYIYKPSQTSSTWCYILFRLVDIYPFLACIYTPFEIFSNAGLFPSRNFLCSVLSSPQACIQCRPTLRPYLLKRLYHSWSSVMLGNSDLQAFYDPYTHNLTNFSILYNDWQILYCKQNDVFVGAFFWTMLV